MAVSNITMTISARHYGFRAARLLALALAKVGFSEATAIRAARLLIVVRIKAGSSVRWAWLGRA